jgi:hypothetical protein
MKKILITQILVCSLFATNAFAEGGADTLHERTNARTQEALAAKQKTQSDNQEAAQSDIKKNSKSSS